jgi:hypothetical protein
MKEREISKVVNWLSDCTAGSIEVPFTEMKNPGGV